MVGQFIIYHKTSQLSKLQSACAFLLVDNRSESNPLSSHWKLVVGWAAARNISPSGLWTRNFKAVRAR